MATVRPMPDCASLARLFGYEVQVALCAGGATTPALRTGFAAALFVLPAAAAGAGVVAVWFFFRFNRRHRRRQWLVVFAGKLLFVFLLTFLALMKSLRARIVTLSHTL